MRSKRFLKAVAASMVAMFVLSACGGASTGSVEVTVASSISTDAEKTDITVSGDTTPTTTDTEKTFVYGTTSYGVAMGDAGLNPHADYSGWSSVRYGVSETLFKLDENINLVNWLADGYTYVDDYTVEITIKDGITFSSGRSLDAQAAKECLEDLIAVHDRAPADLDIKEMRADGQVLTIVTNNPNPVLINFLAEPYSAIIDMEVGVSEDKNVSGTGPYVAMSVSDTEIVLEARDGYWGGEVPNNHITVKAITDGDTLTMGLQSGELDATYGLPYASYPLFENADYTINSTATSRAFFMQLNFNNPILEDKNVRQAIAKAIDKEGFVNILLGGHGKVANGPFPMMEGESAILSYDVEAAKALLASAGWLDSDGDGFVDKDGENLSLSFLTYPGRVELPVLAQSVQANLKEIGIEVEINSTENYLEVVKDSSAWDIFASAMVTNPTGNKGYFFNTTALSTSGKNRGGYSNEELEALATQLNQTFDSEKREELATQMSEILVEDAGFIFASHLQMGIVTKSNITGITPMPSDYYELSRELTIE